jgi:hypothetical protein
MRFKSVGWSRGDDLSNVCGQHRSSRRRRDSRAGRDIGGIRRTHRCSVPFGSGRCRSTNFRSLVTAAGNDPRVSYAHKRFSDVPTQGPTRLSAVVGLCVLCPEPHADIAVGSRCTTRAGTYLHPSNFRLSRITGAETTSGAQRRKRIAQRLAGNHHEAREWLAQLEDQEDRS